MNPPLHVLILEDSPDDAEIIALTLEDGGFAPMWERVETAQAMRLALGKQAWDIIIADHSMPHFSVSEALALLKERGDPIPLIMVSGSITDEIAAQIMRAGARDFRCIAAHVHRCRLVIGHLASASDSSFRTLEPNSI